MNPITSCKPYQSRNRAWLGMSSEGQFRLLYSAAKTNHQPGLEQANPNSKGKAFNVS